MTEPLIIPRSDHPISRNDIDPDALRVLNRLNEHDYEAYLVGGSVRDLLLGRTPKDFDIGTNAHPYEIKKLFRNCWIIGRRFRLAHIKYGTKTIEVATFRQNVPDTPATPADPAPAEDTAPDATPETAAPDAPRPRAHSDEHGIVRRDNLYGTAEDDAFRRDFTINALFYDVATRSVIDYTGGLDHLRHRQIVSIGDPFVRFKEDPVRMLRAAVFAARLDFEMDEQVLEAIEVQGALIQKASPARLLEEYFKILRSGYAEATFQVLDNIGLLGLITPELQDAPEAFWHSLEKLDTWRRHHPTMPAEMVNPVLLGAMLVPLGFVNPHEDQLALGMLTLPRKDYERLRHLLTTAPKLLDANLPARVSRGLPGRPSFSDAITWVDIFGDAPEAVHHWKQVQAQMPKPEPRAHRPHGHGGHHPQHGHASHGAPGAEGGASHGHGHAHTEGAPGTGKRRRRRRRGRGGRGGGGTPTASA